MTPLTIECSAPDHPVKSVTIFRSSKAEVVRTFEVDTKAGQTNICITKLPSSLDINNVRLSTGSSDVRVLDVVSSMSTSAEYKDSIRALKVKKAGLESEKNLREHEADLLVSYARTLSGEHVQPDQVSTFLDSFVERGKKNLRAVTTLAEEIFAIERSIQQETEKSLAKKGETRAQVSVTLAADEAQKVVLKLTYTVSGVHWKPTYELHATSTISSPTTPSPSKPPGHPATTLHYRASLTQSTGEDWTGASLILSTSTPHPPSSIFNIPLGQPGVQGGVPRLAHMKLRAAPATAIPAAPSFLPKSLFGVETGGTGLFGGVPATTSTNSGGLFGTSSNTGGLFGNAPAASANANAGAGNVPRSQTAAVGQGGGGLFGNTSVGTSPATATGNTNTSAGTTTTATKQQQPQQQQPAFGKPSFPQNSFGGGSAGGTFSSFGSNAGFGAFSGSGPSPFGGASSGSQTQGQGGNSSGANVNGQGSTFGSSSFGSAQPAPSTSAFGSSQPVQASSAFGSSQPAQASLAFLSSRPAQATPASDSTPSQSQQQPQQAPGFGFSSSSQHSQNPESGSTFGRPITNSAIAPGFGAFGQPSGFGAPSSQEQLRHPGTGSTFTQGANTLAALGSAQPTSSGFSAFGNSNTQQQQSSSAASGAAALLSLFGSNAFAQQQNTTSAGGPASNQSSSTFGVQSAAPLPSGLGAFGSGGLFGSAVPAPPVSAFGNVSATSSPFNTAPTNPTLDPNAGGSLFGAGTSNTQQQQQSSSGGLFGTAKSAFGGGSAFGGTSNPQPQSQQQQSSAGLFGNTTRNNPPAFGAFPATYNATPAPPTGPTTTTFIKHETSPATSYAVQVQHGGDIPSDGKEHHVVIATIPLHTEQLERVCVPRLGGQVWLQCTLKNTSEYKLIAGPMSIIVDDNFISRDSVGDISPGDTFTCSLGVDPAVHVFYTLTSHIVPAPTASQSLFADSLSTTTFTSQAVLWNKHEYAIGDVVVRDIVPVSEGNPHAHPGSYNYGERVVLKNPASLANVREGTEVGVGVEVLTAKPTERERVDGNLKGEDEGEYVQVEEKGEETENGKGKQKQAKVEKQVKVMWEKSILGQGGEKEGRFEWRCEDVGAGEKVVLEAQWVTKGAPYVRWVEVSA